MTTPADQAGRDCPLCPRLVAYRQANRLAQAAWHNAPVPSFGGLEGQLLVVGLAPGVRGANRTGRPFTGDFAGMLLYRTLLKFGLAAGAYGADAGDGLSLVGCRVTNAVRCVPPGNLPVPAEVNACNPFLTREIAAMDRLRVILALGGVAHKAVLRALSEPGSEQKVSAGNHQRLRASQIPFTHGALHALPNGLVLADSYHVSRLNTNTGRLTEAMFESVISDIINRLR